MVEFRSERDSLSGNLQAGKSGAFELFRSERDSLSGNLYRHGAPAAPRFRSERDSLSGNLERCTRTLWWCSGQSAIPYLVTLRAESGRSKRGSGQSAIPYLVTCRSKARDSTSSSGQSAIPYLVTYNQALLTRFWVPVRARFPIW